MKKIFLATFLICAISMLSYANSTQKGQIILTGKIEFPKGPSRVPAAPSLEAYLDVNVITVNFLRDLGDVQITITDEMGTVCYQSVEYSASGYSAMIDISYLETGFYTISFTNSKGLNLYGEFEYDSY